MNRLLITLSITTIFLLGIVLIQDNQKEKDFNCNNLGIIYIKPNEALDTKSLRDIGIITYIPETETYLANSNIWQCENWELYLNKIMENN